MANKEIKDLSQTTTPAATDKLIIQNAANTYEYQTRAQVHTLQSGEALDTAVGQDMSIKAGGNTIVTLDETNQRVGIKNASPTVELDITGALTISGALTKGSGSFMIDHPLDPANKVLRHSFVESPEMMNVYSGRAELDYSGHCRVEMPKYFPALNEDVRVQLTPLWAPMPGLYVGGVRPGHFEIAGGSPRGFVFWQVVARRKDAYAQKNPIVVEEDKECPGVLIHPEAFDEE